MTTEPIDKIEVKASSNTGLFLGIAVGIILLFAGIFWVIKMQTAQQDPNAIKTLTYENFEFVYFPETAIWKTQWQRGKDLFNIYFHYSPEEAETVPIVQVNPLSESFNSPYYYMTFDPLDGNNTEYFQIATLELKIALERVFNRALVGACIENSTVACHDRPIKNCENTEEPVFYLKQSGSASIVLDGNCIIVSGQDKELIRSIDRLLYHWYRIIPEDVKIIESD
jgi:hypothetical protein